MMKKHTAFSFIVGLSLALCACSSDEPEHVHNFSKLVGIAEGHYYECECGAHDEVRPHTFGDIITDENPSATKSGSAHHICEVCNYSQQFNFIDINNEADLDMVLNLHYPAARIISSFEITKPHYVLSSLSLIATNDVTIKRASTFGGDMFVVGVDENDNSVSWQSKPVTLTLATSDKNLLIDGNRSVIYADPANPTVNVKGSAFFLSGLSTLNLHSGIEISGHKKVDNERVLAYDNAADTTKPFISKPKKVGGAAIVSIDSNVNFYGATIKNNEANDSASVEENLSSYGGAIFSQGLVNIYSGSFTDNVGSYGAVLYSNRMVNIYSATIKDNYSYNYGAIYLGDSQYSNGHFISTNPGDITFEANESGSSGGAVFVSTAASLYTEKVLFKDNITDSNGGAVASKGVTVLKESTFTGNSGSSKGGAVYIYYGDSTDEEISRFSKVEYCVFEENVGGLGSALGVGNSLKIADDPKHFATVTVNNCSFIKNQAVKNSEDKYGHGAVYAQNRCVVIINHSVFEENNAAGYGGAMYITDEAKTYLDSVTFDKNSAASNGGAVYFYTDTYNELRNVTATENHSDNYGGFMYLSARAVVKLYEITSLKNSAKTGGFVYITTANTNLYIYSGSTKECTATTANSENMYGNTTQAYVNIKGTDTKAYFDYDGTLITNKYTLRDILDE